MCTNKCCHLHVVLFDLELLTPNLSIVRKPLKCLSDKSVLVACVLAAFVLDIKSSKVIHQFDFLKFGNTTVSEQSQEGKITMPRSIY